MAKNRAEWASGHRQLTRIGLSDGCGGDLIPVAVQSGYHRNKFEGHLGNVGLSLWPRSAKLSFDIVELQRQAQGSLKPLAARRATGWSNARSRKGAAVFTFPSGESSKVLTASVVARDGSLHGIDCFHLKPNGVSHISEPFIPTTAIEEILVDGLQNFLAVAKEGICLRPPLDVVVSLEGVEGFFLAVDTKYFWSGLVGPVLGERIADVFTIDSYAVDPKELLLPFFRKVYDEAGEQRPDPDVA